MAIERNNNAPEHKVSEDADSRWHERTDYQDPDKFPSMHSRNLMLGGAIAILGLILGGLILGYNVVNNETQRGDSAPATSAVPVRP